MSLFKQKGHYYKPIRVGNFGRTVISNMKVVVIEAKTRFRILELRNHVTKPSYTK